MTARELISDSVPSLKPADTGSKVLAWMSEFKVSHLPVVNGTEYIGLISEEDVLDFNQPEEQVGNHQISLKPSVAASQHLYDVMRLMAEQNLSIIPVLDDDKSYLGLITLQGLLNHFSAMSSFMEPGGILQVEVNTADYSLAEVSQIVESNDARILSFYISSHPNSTRMEITMKINRLDLQQIVATFERYNYTVTMAIQQSEHPAFLKDRLDSLMNYLNI